MHFTQILGINGNDKKFDFKNMLPWIYQNNYGVKKKYNSQDHQDYTRRSSSRATGSALKAKKTREVTVHYSTRCTHCSVDL
jgi:hypothetical protein